MSDRAPINDRTSPIHSFADALEQLDELGLRAPERMPAVLAGSLRPDPDPARVWVYDEANHCWLRVHVRVPRRRWRDRVLRRRRVAQAYRDAEHGVERVLRARFN